MTNAKPTVVVIDTSIPAHKVKELRRLSKRLRVHEAATPEALTEAHVVYTEGVTLDPRRCPRLALVQTDSAAVHHLTDKPVSRAGVPVCNVRGAYTPAVAEFAVGLMLSATRRLPRCHNFQAQAHWPADYYASGLQGVNCYGKTIGIVGYGSIGRHIARITNAMGMRVLACKRKPSRRTDDGWELPGVGDPDGTLPEGWFGVGQIERMLPRLDFCVVTLPLTAETRGLFNRRRIGLLPRHAVLVNVGRGGIVDEDALRDAVTSGRLAGAMVDTFATEPLPAGSPLWMTPNIGVAPHIASFTVEQQALAADVLIENVRRYLRGQPFINVVDLNQGY